jgi:serine/threonine protein kinase
LKPGNILLKRRVQRDYPNQWSEKFIKIADFGLIVMHVSNEQLHTIDKGTPKFMAPEVINSEKYSTKADIYSIGIIFQNLFDLEFDRY